mmetsp:Transcript_77950/g.215493  ORF Transcript_77950/g.215493 Transcript_77950/m.215493 type:complete len:1080 (+) Transcript_77950:124-3363(+)
MSGVVVGLTTGGNRTFPAKKVAEAVHWSGIHVSSVGICYDGCRATSVPGVSTSQSTSTVCGVNLDDSDWSGVDDEVPGEFDVRSHETGRPAVNIYALKSMDSLTCEHQHNPNLVMQFQELSRSFKAWRPIRGDGNCYYRAVLFSWLERSLALGTLENLQSFDANLRAHRRVATVPNLQTSIRTCHRLLKAWIAKRAQCSSDSEVCTLLMDVSNEFNKEQSDLAFILCLRHLIAEYLRQHAHDPVASCTDAGNVLTYESWAIAIFGSKSIEDYCEQHVYVMNKEAADHVQHVCPRVLQTAVRICMVDRDTARCNFIDYGGGSAMPPSGETVKSAAELVSTSGQCGMQPELFLLLKPGHYDVLLPRGDGAGRLLDPEPGGSTTAALAASVAPQRPGQAQLAAELCGTFRAVLRCLEEKLAEELHAKRRRLGSVDESLFEGQLNSVLDPLRDVLARLGNLSETGPLVHGGPLLPSLEGFFRQKQVGTLAEAPRAPPVPPPAPVPSPAPGPVRVTVPVEVVRRQQPLAGLSAPSPASVQQGGNECCICMRGGASTVAGCGCAYHSSCLLEYVQMEGRPPQSVSCHLHDRPLGHAFVLQHLPGPATPPPRGESLASAPLGAKVKGAPAGPSPPLSSSIVKEHTGDDGSRWQVPVSCVIRAPLLGGFRALGTQKSAGSIEWSAPSRHVPPSTKRILQSGNLGAALGVPCVICFGEDGILKTLHCNYKVHVKCLKSFWSEKVVTLCRLTDIRCPAEVAGCSRSLDEADLRGVISSEDLAVAQRNIRDVDDQNRQLIDELKRQSEEYRPMFRCAICLIEHEVEGCCTLPCQHRFCFESLQYHFDIIVRERRLSKLTCPVEGCGHNLRTEESIHIFQQCLSEETYHKLLEFLTRDDPHIYECKQAGCEERVFLDDGDDFADLACPRGHRFCGRCEHGPHPEMSCEERQEELDRERREVEVQRDQDEAWRSALALGWKPCPRRCAYGGGYKAADECDHVTCECGFEFCWDCGVERQVPLLHDNRWHKPSCHYHTRPCEVAEQPKFVPSCPGCKMMPVGVPCSFPVDDGYPESYIKRRPQRRKGRGMHER